MNITYDIHDDSLLARSMRRVRQYWPHAYSKLLAMTWKESSSTPYGATDGINLVLNPKGLERIASTSDPVGHCAFLLVHEALHGMLSHGSRLAKFTDHNTANKAADYVINAMIVHRNKEVFRSTRGKTLPFPLIANVLIDEKLSGDKSVEELYNELYQAPEPELSQQPQAQPEPEPEPEQDDSQDNNEDGGDDKQDDNQNASDSDSDPAGSDDGASDDANPDGDGDAQASASGTGKQSDSQILGDEWVGTGSEDTFEPQAEPKTGESKEDIERKIEEQNEQIILTEKLNASAGMHGATGVRQIEKLRAYREGMDWADYLKQWFSARCQSGWEKPFNAPIYTTTGLVSVGRQRKSVNELAVVIDTSCSVPQSILREMLESVQDALNTLRPDKIYLLSVDHRVQQVIELQHGDDVPTSIKGGGGTLFKPVFDWVEDNAPHIDGLVYLTDGDAYDWSEVEEPSYPVLWLDYGKYPEVYKFGERVKVSLR
jgi:predicted metal-dependent peptidase